MPLIVSKGLAFAFLSGPWTESELVARGHAALGEQARWVRPLVRRLLARMPAPPVGREDDLAALLVEDKSLRRAALRHQGRSSIVRWFIPARGMARVAGPPAGFLVPPLATLGALAEALEVDVDELEWFADLRGINAKASSETLFHYRYQWVPKARGGYRLLEAPKPRLKKIQRWILRDVLAAIPASPTAHGFVVGRDVRSFVEPHVGQAVVVRLDLEDFFPSVSRARVRSIFRRVGYPTDVAAALAGLCTAPTPLGVLGAHPREGVDLARRFLVNQRLREPHLPQGAPTSPALSNLAAWRLDRRLTALAAGFGATMTRYADDLAFAGDGRFARELAFFLPRVAGIVRDEGFRVNDSKTRIMPSGRRQQLCGLVTNQRPNLPRRERDNLRALLFNAVRFGPESQNHARHPDFRRHLEGRVAWAAAVNPTLGARLTPLLARIPWPAPLPG